MLADVQKYLTTILTNNFYILLDIKIVQTHIYFARFEHNYRLKGQSLCRFGPKICPKGPDD